MYYWLIPDFYPPLNVYEAPRFVGTIGWTPMTDTMDKRTRTIDRFVPTEIMGTLASQVEIGVWV